MPVFDSHPPFRRLTDPVLVPVGPTASACAVPAIPNDATSFYVVNSNLCYVRLSGFRDAQGQAAENKGWLFPPGHAGVYATQLPKFMSAIAVAREGFPITGISFASLEVSYGSGT